MASTGIAEHHEALRKQAVINRRAYIAKQLEQKYGPNYENKLEVYPSHSLSAYDEEMKRTDPDMIMRKMGSPPNMKDYRPPITDKLRRDQVREQELIEYTAKIPDRFRSINYIQQW